MLEEIAGENVYLLVVFNLFEVIKKTGDNDILIFIGIFVNPFEH